MDAAAPMTTSVSIRAAGSVWAARSELGALRAARERTVHWPSRRCVLALALGFPLLLLAPAGSAAAHFALAPRIEVEPPALDDPLQPLVRRAEGALSRGEFALYLQRLTAFDTKYERTQPAFAAYFGLVRSAALLHPENVHGYVDALRAAQGESARERALQLGWIEGQAELFALLAAYAERGRLAGAAQDARQRVIARFHAAGAKAAFLEQLVVLGEMAPSVEGLERYLQGLTPEQRDALGARLEEDSGELTPPAEQRALLQRWLQFRRDALARAGIEQRCEAQDSVQGLAPEHALLQVGAETIDWAAIRAVYGEMESDRLWQRRRGSTCAQLALLLALDQLAERLGIVPPSVRAQIASAEWMLRAGMEIARRFGPQLAPPGSGAGAELSAARALLEFPQVLALRDALVAEARQLVARGGARIDREYLRTVPWALRRRLAPQHSIHL
jgi:hypothetical protein